MSLPSLIWLLPVVFMIHDFEEIIMMKPWLQKNAALLQHRFPRLAAIVLPHMAGLSTSAFALAVAEELLLLAAISWATVEYGWYSVWAGVVLAFFIHLVMHIGQFVVFGRYVPVVITSILTSGYCIYALGQLSALGLLVWSEVARWTVVALVVVIVNVLFAHWLAARFEAWLQRYAEI